MTTNAPSSEGTTYPIVAVNAVIFDTVGRVLLSRRADDGLWCLPGGMILFGETVEQALVRELWEEIGVKPYRLRLVGVYSQNNLVVLPTAKRCSIVIVFECAIDGQEPGMSDEVTAVAYYPITELPTDIISTHPQRIHDAARRDQGAVVA